LGSPPVADHSPGRTFLRFLRFGVQAWGGPVAQIAMIRRALVEDEGWVSSGRFNRLLAVYQVLPGPEAHELCVHLGMLKGGRIGGLMAGLGFMLPGFVLMFALSWAYFAIDIARSPLGPAFLGVQVAVLALIVRACQRIASHILVEPILWAIAGAVAVASFLGASFWVTLPLAGVIYVLWHRSQPLALVTAAAGGVAVGLSMQLGGPGPAASLGGPLLAVEPSAVVLFLSGLKAGLLTFGGAYTAIPFLRDDAVGSGWMTDAQFLDGLALSGILPAPLIIFSTFVGYVAAGPPGAIAMTAGIFMPAFGFSLLFHDRLEAVIESPTMRTFLDGVAAAVVGLIVATTIELAAALVDRLPSLIGGVTIFVAALGVLVLWRARTTVVFVVLGAGIAGFVAFGGL
jgi:chromate transporter